MKSSSLGRLFLISGILLIDASTALHAQVLDEKDEGQVIQNAFELHESNFDLWIYGQTNRTANGRVYLENLLSLSLTELEWTCALSDGQKKKLRLAGQGDIKHFLDRVAEARKIFDLYRHDQTNITMIHQETLPLSKSIQDGIFGSDSLYFKTVTTTLGPEQVYRYRRALYDKALFRHQALVRLAVTNLDNAIGFTAEQRHRLTELALAETKPSSRSVLGTVENQVVLLKIARIPAARIWPILDERRCVALGLRLQQAKAREVVFESNGYLDELEPPTAAKPSESRHD